MQILLIATIEMHTVATIIKIAIKHSFNTL